jgi:small subunit ribosomal protein S4
MKRQRKQYSRPKKPWSRERLDVEGDIIREYGLRRKKEIWVTEAKLRDYRRKAREIVSTNDKIAEKILIDKLASFGLISTNAHLDEILALKIEGLLDRRLQTIIFKKGIASTQKQSRQFITHGHIAVDGRRVTWPSALINLEEEAKIGLYTNSALNESLVKIKKAANAHKKVEEKKEGEAKSVEEKTEAGKGTSVPLQTHATEKVEEVKETVEEKVAEEIPKVVEAVENVVEKVVEVVEQVKEAVEEKVEELEKPTVEEVKPEEVKE